MRDLLKSVRIITDV